MFIISLIFILFPSYICLSYFMFHQNKSAQLLYFDCKFIISHYIIIRDPLIRHFCDKYSLPNYRNSFMKLHRVYKVWWTDIKNLSNWWCGNGIIQKIIRQINICVIKSKFLFSKNKTLLSVCMCVLLSCTILLMLFNTSWTCIAWRY